jgi:ankyrin repeat protein
VQVLLEAGSDIEARDSAGRSALWRAAHEGQLEVVERLIKSGASIDLPSEPWGKGLREDGGVWWQGGEDYHDTTPLHEAVKGGHLLVAQALLAANADPNRERKGVTLLQLACGMGQTRGQADLTRNVVNVPMATLLIWCGADVTASFPEERGMHGVMYDHKNWSAADQLRARTKPFLFLPSIVQHLP